MWTPSESARRIHELELKAAEVEDRCNKILEHTKRLEADNDRWCARIKELEGRLAAINVIAEGRAP